MMHLSRAIGTSGEEEKGQERSGCTKRWAVSDMYPPLRDTADLKRGCTHTSPLHPNRGLQIQLRVTEATNPAWLPKVHGCYLKGPGTTGQNDTHCLGQKKGELGLYKHCTGRWSRRRRPYAPAQLHQCAISTVAGSSRCSRRFPSFQKCDYLGFFLKKNQDAAGRGGYVCVWSALQVPGGRVPSSASPAEPGNAHRLSHRSPGRLRVKTCTNHHGNLSPFPRERAGT